MKISPIVKHLVLIGGGHSHLAVLRRFGMHPVPGLAVTLISREVVTPYSGSLPAHLVGLYSRDLMHIDLRPLAQFAGARLIQSEVTKINLEDRSIELCDRPDIPFDCLSLNIGSRPDSALITGASNHALAVKPIDKFLREWKFIKQQASTTLSTGENYRLAIVGGGPASVELAFASQIAIEQCEGTSGQKAGRLQICLVTAGDKLLTGHSTRSQEFALRELESRGVEIRFGGRVARFGKNRLVLTDDTELECDAAIYATGASLPEWPFQCGLAKSADGFIEVGPTLQTSSHDFVFAAGDAATIRNEPRPKSGVYAVRQGKILAMNLRRFVTGRPLKRYTPQKKTLALISMSNKSAIATRGDWFFQSASMWRLKDIIDRRFLKKYSELPQMPVELDIAPGLLDQQAETKLRNHAMRCAGCGAKVASSVLEEVLDELPELRRDDVLSESGGAEDASRIQLPDGRILLQSLDFIKAFTHDPFLFGKIATNHSLSDIYAMGVQAHSALALAGLPFAERRYSRQQLRELMLGCSEALEENGCSLIGGHSAEAEQLQFGMAVNGFAAPETILTKSNLKIGDTLILTKPLGSGTLLAADMRHQARHEWMDALMQSMLSSNRKASEISVAHGAHACTDITGFGLLGHLLEMLANNCMGVTLLLEQIPTFAGALTTLGSGIVSSLHTDNQLNAARISNQVDFQNHDLFPVLFDPQTAGGLLISLPRSRAKACLDKLVATGHDRAAIIGEIIEAKDAGTIILS
ncbi:MAG TPA: selenide, water dikinase SelD [Gammaproteobacteria bacterium]|nr:selenide, water dikinase SelD [Gammaproteobacteria bacterium]